MVCLYTISYAKTFENIDNFGNFNFLKYFLLPKISKADISSQGIFLFPMCIKLLFAIV